MSLIKKKKINEIIEENYVFAAVLHYFGIDFYNYSDKTLEQVCSEKKIDTTKVLTQFEQIDKEENIDFLLKNIPLDLLIEYLKHVHHLFVKQKLPYLAGLVSSYKPLENQDSDELDIKFIFPSFVQDFIYHLYEEEDNLFSYIKSLIAIDESKIIPSSELNQQIESKTIQKYAHNHEVHDDEMAGIRELTNNYKITNPKDIHLKVIYAELQNFELDLIKHAKIEDHILFPKALDLEKRVYSKFILA